MIPILTVLLVLALSLLIARFATVGLAMTGVFKDLAQFPALSAFTGSGFTTQLDALEAADKMVQSPEDLSAAGAEANR